MIRPINIPSAIQIPNFQTEACLQCGHKNWQLQTDQDWVCPICGRYYGQGDSFGCVHILSKRQQHNLELDLQYGNTLCPICHHGATKAQSSPFLIDDYTMWPLTRKQSRCPLCGEYPILSIMDNLDGTQKAWVRCRCGAGSNQQYSSGIEAENAWDAFQTAFRTTTRCPHCFVKNPLLNPFQETTGIFWACKDCRKPLFQHSDKEMLIKHQSGGDLLCGGCLERCDPMDLMACPRCFPDAYQCPECHRDHTLLISGHTTATCVICGFEVVSPVQATGYSLSWNSNPLGTPEIQTEVQVMPIKDYLETLQ